MKKHKKKHKKVPPDYPKGLYSIRQRLSVFGFLMGIAVVMSGVFCFALFFFRSVSFYGYICGAAAFGALLIASLIVLFGKALDVNFGRVKNWVFPIVGAFLASLLLFVVLSELGVLNLSPIVRWFVK